MHSLRFPDVPQPSEPSRHPSRRPLKRLGRLVLALLALALCLPPMVSAQVGNLLWEENFDTLDTDRWTIDIGDGCDQGLCGWGNQELQSYEAANVTIEAVPGEPGNNALVLEARSETSGGLAFTSGKIQSKNKIAVQYGMVEIRMRVPSVETGLWPAAWLLGTSTATWPAKGEIDMMEMGHSFASRDRQGFGSTSPNSYVGSNIIFYSADACVEGNPTCAASSSWEPSYNTPYASATPLNDRFVKYRLYWTDTDIQFSVTDGALEHFLHASPFPLGGEADEFNAPFYLLLNLAVGGNFTDALTNGQVTAPLPAKMYVDYVRVYEYNGQGQVILGDASQPEYGTFGVFTETTTTDNGLQAGSTSDIWIWDGTTTQGTTAPLEGSEVIAWNVQGGTWFGGGIQARQPLNMSQFGDGNLKFSIKLPRNIDFRVGITDTYGNENWIDFPARTTTYGLARNGQWGQATIPVADLRGTLVALQSLSYAFAIAADSPSKSFQLGLDDIYWEGGGAQPDPDTDGDGVLDSADQCPGTPAGTPVDATGCPLDSDGDGVDDSADQCPGTPAGTQVDATGCPVSSSLYGLTETGADSIEFFVNTTAWADVHYTVNGGGQLNVRMTQTGSRNVHTLSGLSIGDVINYNFTYWDTDGNFAVDTDWESHTFGGSAPTDSDGDGVPDASDQCPSTPAGVPVDADGCTLDSDGDGVHDGIDQCPGTPAGTTVDAVGCAVPEPVDVQIEAEDYTAYFDNDAGNNGGAYRSDDVDIEATTDTGGGYNVGWTQVGEWLEYDVSFIAGTYDVSTRVASQVGGGAYTLLVDGATVGSGSVAATGGWQVWQTQSVGSVTLTGGNHTVRINVTGPDFNLNWIRFDVGSAPTDSDGDGVVDGQDQCPGTAAGTAVDATGCPLPADSDGDGVPDASDQCPGTPTGTTVDAAGCEINLGSIVPLYGTSTVLEPAIQFETADALVTRFTDRARDRHAKENHYQAYDHYLSFYWEFRTAQIEIIDKVAKGGSTIRMNVTIDHPLDDTEAENRWFYIGNNTLAEYCGNGTMNVRTDVQNPDPNLYYYYKEESLNCRNGYAPIQIGDKLEFEVSQFLGLSTGGGGLLSGRGRANYYGSTFLYIVGEGIVPWEGSDYEPFVGGNTFQRDSVKIPESAWLGGRTTIHAHQTAEPDNHFLQMAGNLGYENGQPFVDGRRLIHTSFVDGDHVDESPDNPDFTEMSGKAGTHFVNESCISCHIRNGRATPEAVGVPLDRWVFKVGDANGNPDPNIGAVLQPSHTPGAIGEGSVSIASWTENNGLRSPNFAFSGTTPARFSPRIAPQLVGMGLLEAIPESAVIALEDENDADGDGISGRAHRVVDPVTGDTRLGRFGWKAMTSSVRHQVAAALNTDVGVMTSVLPNPDCGSAQTDCGNSGSELSDAHLADMVKYVSLLGIRPQRDHGDAEVIAGKGVFSQIGCNDCHVDTMQTSAYHPLAELRDQTIHPYTDLLLHDMGPGLADNLGEGQAGGSEWRTTPLWGLGLSACVAGGVTGTPGGSAFGVDGNETCVPDHGYLHDGRARTIEEAILWHGGEGESSKNGYQALSASDKAALLKFLESL